MQCYPKRIYDEHWDDYQLMCIAKGCGGNRPIYMLFKEYDMESKEYKEKYTSRAFQWY